MSHRRIYAALLLIGIFLVSAFVAFSAQATSAQAAQLGGSSRAISQSVLSGVAGGTGTPTATPIIFTPTVTPTVTATPGCGLAWNIIGSPNPGQFNNSVNSIAAVSANDVWAVGSYSNASSMNTAFVLHWNGTAWALVTSPNPGIVSYLSDVVAVSANDVWGVGYYIPTLSDPDTTFIIHWNGTAWTQQTGTAIFGGGVLYGITAFAANNLWAVGYRPGATEQALTMHYDGTQWNIVAAANPDPNSNVLWSVSGDAPNHIWAVGYSGASGSERTLIELWNGTTWSAVSSPNSGSSGNQLYNVVALSANDAWAVGYNGVQGIILHWNGTAWSLATFLSGGFSSSALFSISANAPNDIWAVGAGRTGSNPTQTLTLNYNGSAWSVVASPNVPGGHTQYLNAVDTIMPNDAWAGGICSGCGTLLMHYADPCGGTVTPTLTPTVTVSPTPCSLSFSDVHPTDYFYTAVQYLACHGAISGYADGTFRPYNDTTRGQLTKIVVLAEGFPINTAGGPHFTDVPTTNPFYVFIETAYNRGLISGYADGSFRWGNNITRGQLSKVVVLAEEWTIDTTGGPHFTDVPTTHPFYPFVETAYNHGIIAGYSDGTFRPQNNATRGQISVIVFRAISQP